MKILIISDNHGDKDSIKEVVGRHSQEVEAMIHCGDSELPYKEEIMLPFIRVAGNADFDESYPNERIETIGGIPFFITHGHLYNVKGTMMNLSLRSQELGVKIVCFGHSHVAYTESEDDIIYINPGSIKRPRVFVEKSYVICTLEGETIAVDYYDETGTLLPKFNKRYIMK